MEPTLRSSTLQDLELHTRHRVEMFRDMGLGTEQSLKAMVARWRPWLRRRLISGEMKGFVLESQGQAVASTLLWLREAHPGPLFETDLRPYLLNVYTEPPWRGKGLARRLTEACLEFCRELKLPILELHASKAGESLYRNLGFTFSNEMRLILNDQMPVPEQWKDRR
jgi:GNAT superfamily N-acetyltransferase